MSEAPRPRGLFWGHAAAFGALWGAVEATLGSYLHALKVPFTGTVLAGFGAALLISLRIVHPRRGVVLAAGAVCAVVKMVSPSTNVLGPMVGIMVESLLVELACLAGAHPVSAVLGGALATSWALCQKVLTQVLFYGAPLLDLYKELLERAESWLGLGRAGGYRAAGILWGIVALVGALLASWGLSVGREALRRRASETSIPSKKQNEAVNEHLEIAPSTLRPHPPAAPPPSPIARAIVMLSGAALVVLAALGPPRLHLPAAVLSLVILWLIDRPLASRVGRPLRWLVALVVLAAFGAWLGPHREAFHGLRISQAGVFEATTMIARSLGLVLVTSALMSLVPRERVLGWLAKTPLAPLVEVAVVAVGLVPSVITKLREHAAAIRSTPRDRSRVLGFHESAVTLVMAASATAIEAASELQQNRTPRPVDR